MFKPHSCPQPRPPSLHPSLPVFLRCSLTPSVTPERFTRNGSRHYQVLTSRPTWYSWVRLFKNVCWKWGEWQDGCVSAGWGWRRRVYRVYMKHHYHIKDTLGFSVLMVITLHTIGTHCSDHNNKKKKNFQKKWMEGWGGGILKGSRGGTIGLGFQVMLITLIYLISGWRWALFTSDEDTGNCRENGGDERETECGVIRWRGFWCWMVRWQEVRWSSWTCEEFCCRWIESRRVHQSNGLNVAGRTNQAIVLSEKVLSLCVSVRVHPSVRN